MISIRGECNADHAGIRNVHQCAFGSSVEADLVDDLRSGGFSCLSLVAVSEERVIGHILFSHLSVVTGDKEFAGLSLAPMAVHPEWQRQGVGSELVHAGLTQCRQHGHRFVLVLGHPDYYSRLGFSAQMARPLTSPFGQGDAWMALELSPGALRGVRGHVEYSSPFLKLL